MEFLLNYSKRQIILIFTESIEKEVLKILPGFGEKLPEISWGLLQFSADPN